MALSDRATADVVNPLYLAWLDFSVDPIRAWTGPADFAVPGGATGDPDIDSTTFLSVDGAASLSGIKESLNGNQPVKIIYSAHDLDAPGMKQIVKDGRDWQIQRAKIWTAFLMDDRKTVHPEIEQVFSGVIVNANTTRQFGQPSTLIIELDNDLRLGGDGGTRWLDHARFNAGDTASSFIIRLANGLLSAGQRAGGLQSGRGGNATNSRSGGGGRNYQQH